MLPGLRADSRPGLDRPDTRRVGDPAARAQPVASSRLRSDDTDRPWGSRGTRPRHYAGAEGGPSDRESGGSSVHARAQLGETLTGYAARRAGKGPEMRKYLTLRLTVQLKVDVAACLKAVAVLVYLLS